MVFSGFGFLGMVFRTRISELRLLVYRFFALRVCGEGFLDMAFGGGDTVLLGFC